jgi:uroporphyrinogen-III decarboxylase
MAFGEQQWTSRKRVLATIDHKEPDRVPIDLGGTLASGIMAVPLHHLYQRLGFKGKRVKVHDIFQMLGEVEMDLVKKLHIDVLPVEPPTLWFGIKRENYKPWKLFDGAPVLIPSDFNVEVDEEGNWLLHEGGNFKKPLVAKMPKDGYYFDFLGLTKISDKLQRPSLNKLREEYLLTEEEIEFMANRSSYLRKETDKALVAGLWVKGSLGTIGSLPDFLISIASDKGYVKEFLHKKQEIVMENLRLFWKALGENIDIVLLEGMDFGAQDSELISPVNFEELYLPHYREQFAWIHEHTTWKVLQHCCGSISKILPLLVDAGLDIINPVQTSAYGMNPKWLKEQIGDRITFWGGGVDTQKTLPFGTPEQVSKEVEERIKIFAPGGGFVFSTIHNIQYSVPVDNIIAAFTTAHDRGQYPIN